MCKIDDLNNNNFKNKINNGLENYWLIVFY